MKKFSMLFLLVFLAGTAYASTKNNIVVDAIEVYTDKSQIAYLGNDGWAIPKNTPLIVMRSTKGSHKNFKFVAYGDSMKQMLSLWLTAKTTGNRVFCNWIDLGNYWVQCVGTGFE